MALKCSQCGSLNAEDLTMCGNCGTPLTQADRFMEEKRQEPLYEGDEPCPYCGGPMEQGVLEISGRHIVSASWINHSDETTPLGSGSLGLCEFEGWRCKSCNRLFLDY